MNDDAFLQTEHGFRKLATCASYGLVSAGITGFCGKPVQVVQTSTNGGLRDVPSDTFAFICVFIPRAVLDEVGGADERFLTYGYEDDDLSLRIKQAGFKLAVHDGCVVEHGSVPSVFQQRTGRNLYHNRKLFQEKWGHQVIAGLLRVKNEARWVAQAIKSILPICSRIFVLDDHSSDNTALIAHYVDHRVTVIPSPFSGVDEVRDKNYLLDCVAAHEDVFGWGLMIDGDEQLRNPQTILDTLASNIADSYAFRVYYLWNQPTHYRSDGVYGNFWRPSLFRLKSDVKWPPTTHGGNFHCTNSPYETSAQCTASLLHWGYLHQHDRLNKYAFYSTIDPDNWDEDYYRQIIQGDIGGPKADEKLRYGGPLRLEPVPHD